MITEIYRLEDFKPNNDIIIGLVMRKATYPNIRELKIFFDEIYLGINTYVTCYITEPSDIQLRLKIEGKFIDCLNKINENYEIFIFRKYIDFHNWYIERTKEKHKIVR